MNPYDESHPVPLGDLRDGMPDGIGDGIRATGRDATRAAVDAVKTLLASYVLGDNDGLLECVHPDCVFRFPGDPAVVPWAGLHRGRDGMHAFMEKVKDTLYMLDHIPRIFVPIDGARVLVKSWESARVKATGRVFEHELMALATLRDGLVIDWDEYADTGAIERAFRDPEVAAG